MRLNTARITLIAPSHNAAPVSNRGAPSAARTLAVEMPRHTIAKLIAGPASAIFISFSR